MHSAYYYVKSSSLVVVVVVVAAAAAAAAAAAVVVVTGHWNVLDCSFVFAESISGLDQIMYSIQNVFQ